MKENREQWDEQLKTTLTRQEFEANPAGEEDLQAALYSAEGFAKATQGVAVISDFYRNVGHIYAGSFGKEMFGLPEYSCDDSSAFEDAIFERVEKEDLMRRHILELRFFNFLNAVEPKEKTNYQAQCLLTIRRPNDHEVHILHTTRYISCFPNGSVRAGICTYIPFSFGMSTMEGVVHIHTGEMVERTRYTGERNRILSKRQIEVLALLARGLGSKQIADQLSISLNTVNRHRQDILSLLKVSNTAAAVEIGMRMGMI